MVCGVAGGRVVESLPSLLHVPCITQPRSWRGGGDEEDRSVEV